MASVCCLQPGYGDTTVEQGVLSPAGVAVTMAALPADGADIPDALRTADVILVRSSVIAAATLASFPSAKAIIRCGAGYDNVDLAAARERGIMVANTPGYDKDEVSTQALSMFLALRRHLIPRDRAVRAGAWHLHMQEPIDAVRTSVVGIVGYGAIGRVMHRKLAGLGITEVQVHDPYLPDDVLAAAGVRRAPLDEICRTATLITLHCPLTQETHHMIGADQLALMRPDAILVNTARGGVVDGTALAAALQAGQIAGAGVDVFEHEPPAPDHPLFACENAILSDHCGWYSEQAVSSVRTLAAQDALRVIQGGEPLSWVNRW